MFERQAEIDGEFVTLRGLSYGEFYFIRNKEIKTERLLCYEICKIGVMNIMLVDESNVTIKYDPEIHFDELFDNNYEFFLKCFKIIVEELTVLSETYADLIKSFVAFQVYLSDKDERIVESWSCKSCIEKKLLGKRKCGRFDQDTIQKILNNGYLPYEIFGFNQAVQSVEEKQQIPDTVQSQIDKRNARYKKPKQIMPGQPQSPADAPEPAGVVSLRSPYYTWNECPAFRGDSKFVSFLHLILASYSQDAYPNAGGQFDQSNKFIEGLALLRSEFNRLKNLEEKRMMKESESKNKPKGKR